MTILEAENNSRNPIVHIKGFYTYIGDDGNRYTFSYVADQKGYQQKVLFGKDVEILRVIENSLFATLPPMGIDGTVLCSLLGH